MRVPPQPLGAVAWYLRPLFWLQRRRYGAVLDSARVWARSPRLFLGIAVMFGGFERHASPLERRLRGVVMVRVSQINDCAFCVDINAATLLRLDASAPTADAIAGWRESGQFGARERAALDYAEAMTRSDRRVDDALFRVVAEHFDEAAIVELTGLIAFQNMSSKFNAALAIPSQGFCALAGTPRAGAPPDS